MKDVARHAPAVDSDDRLLIACLLVAMHQHQGLKVGVGPLVGSCFELQLPTSELDGKDRLSCPVQLQLDGCHSIRFHRTLQAARRRDMGRQFGSCKGDAPATPRHKLLLRFRLPSPGTHHYITASPTCLSAPPQRRRDSLAEETRLARSCPHWIRPPSSYFDNRPNMNACCMPPVPLGRPSTGDSFEAAVRVYFT